MSNYKKLEIEDEVNRTRSSSSCLHRHCVFVLCNLFSCDQHLWCKKHFNHSEGTQFTKAEWVKKLNVLDNESEINTILEGKEISHLEGRQKCMEWIQDSKRKGGTGSVKFDATYKEFQHFVSKVKEEQSGGLSGR